jgi:hypothetical protein
MEPSKKVRMPNMNLASVEFLNYPISEEPDFAFSPQLEDGSENDLANRKELHQASWSRGLVAAHAIPARSYDQLTCWTTRGRINAHPRESKVFEWIKAALARPGRLQ